MTVLWMLLGVLAAIVLLLCLPLTLRLSWLPKPEQPAPCLLTDEVNKEIEALDLPQTDRQLLRQMVEQTKAPPVTENQLKVDVKVLLFTIHLFPFAQKKKVTPQKQQKQPQKKQEKASDSNEQKPKTSEILALLPQLWQCAKKPLQMVLGDVCLHHLKLYGIVSREDTAQSALEAQKFSTILYTLLGMVQNIGRVKRTDIRIEPDFWGSGQERWQLRFSLTVHPIVAVAAAVRFAACFLRQLLSRKETDKPQQKDSTSCTTDSGKSAPQTQGAQQ